jgi:hypothetical protein
MGLIYAGAGLSATFYAGALCAAAMMILLVAFDREKSEKNEFS